MKLHAVRASAVSLIVSGLLLGCTTAFPILSGGPPQVHYVIRTEPELEVARGTDFILATAEPAQSLVLDDVGSDDLPAILDTLNSSIAAGPAAFDHSVRQVTLSEGSVQAAIEHSAAPPELLGSNERYWIAAIRTRNPRLEQAHELAARAGPRAAFRSYRDVWATEGERDAGFNTALLMLQDERFSEAYAILRVLDDTFPQDSQIRILTRRLEHFLF